MVLRTVPNWTHTAPPSPTGRTGHPDLQGSCLWTSTLKPLTGTPRARDPPSRKPQAAGPPGLGATEGVQGGGWGGLKDTSPPGLARGSWAQHEVHPGRPGREAGGGACWCPPRGPSTSPTPQSLLSCPQAVPGFHLGPFLLLAAFPSPAEKPVVPPGGSIWEGRQLVTWGSEDGAEASQVPIHPAQALHPVALPGKPGPDTAGLHCPDRLPPAPATSGALESWATLASSWGCEQRVRNISVGIGNNVASSHPHPVEVLSPLHT